MNSILEDARKTSENSIENTKVGCVLAVDDTIIARGFNYNLFGNNGSDNRDQRLSEVIHAEVVALDQVKYVSDKAKLYVYPTFLESICCHECAKMIIRKGITHVVGYKCEATDYDPRWKASSDAALKLFKKAGVTIEFVPFQTD